MTDSAGVLLGKLNKGTVRSRELARAAECLICKQGPEFRTQSPHVKSRVWHVPVILVLERQSRVDLRSLLDRQPNLTGKRPCFKKQGKKGQLNLYSGFHTCMYMLTHKGAST